MILDDIQKWTSINSIEEDVKLHLKAFGNYIEKLILCWDLLPLLLAITKRIKIKNVSSSSFSQYKDWVVVLHLKISQNTIFMQAHL